MKRNFTSQEDTYLQNNYLLVSRRQMERDTGIGKALINRRMKELNLLVPPGTFSSQFKKGHVSPNKGRKQTEFMSGQSIENLKNSWFKKGAKTHNSKNEGAVTIRLMGGNVYRWKKVNGKWVQLHIYNWLQAGNTIPEGFILRFKDGNTLNADVSNLNLITRRQHMLLNISWAITKVRPKKVRIKEAKRMAKIAAREKEVKQKPFKKENERRQKAAEIQRQVQIKNDKKPPLFKIKQVDYTQMIKVRVDPKTIVYAKPGQDPEEVKKHYLANRSACTHR